MAFMAPMERGRSGARGTRRALALAAVALAIALTLAARTAAAQSGDDEGGGGPAPAGDSTEFKPAVARFVLKRATTQLPTVAEAASLAAARGAGGPLSGVDPTPEVSGARLSPAAERRQERVQAALDGGEGSESSSSGIGSAARAAGEASLASLRARLAAAAGLGPSAGAATRSSAAGAATTGAAAAAEGVKRSWRSLNAFEAADAVGNPQNVAFIPPDAAMAVGAGFVVASVNNAVRVYDSATGSPLSPPVDLTVLFGLPPLAPLAPIPAAGCGDRLVDPTTLYDPELRRWFQTMARIEQAPATCAPTGKYYVEVAVSATASPLGSWHVYSVDAGHNGGEAGGGAPLPECEAEGCFVDFPRAQVDANALVVSTNSFLGRSGGFVAATVYALDKSALAKGLGRAALAEFVPLTLGAWDDDAPVFSLSPAYVPPRKKGAAAAARSKKASLAQRQKTRRAKRDHKKKKGGGGGGGGGPAPYKEPFYLLSRSEADTQRLIRWVLDGTRALRRATTQQGLDALLAALTLTASPVVLPDPLTEPSVLLALQPAAGEFPYGRSLGFTSPGFLGGPDGRMASTAFAAGRLYGVFNVFVFEEIGGEPFPFYAVVLVQIDAKTGAALQTSFLGAQEEDTTWPAVAVDGRGRGAVVAMVSSEARYASVGLFRIAEGGAVGPREVAMEGAGLEDGQTQYVGRPRAGDYSTAVVEAETGDLWAACEYVSRMSCGAAEWGADPTCGGTRVRRSNWDTGVLAVRIA